ncbi:MAG: phage terminase large subunit [Devosia sp.]
MHPERESIKTLADIRHNVGEYNFAGQYQQTPAPLGGGMVRGAWFQRFQPGEEPSNFDRIVQSWDTANKPTELADYSVCTTWGLKGPHFYLLGVLRRKMGYPELRRAVLEQHAAHHPHAILIEDKASGTQLIQDLIENGISAVTRFEPDGDKIMRLHAQSSAIENGFVHLPSGAPWLADYLHEFTTFPNGRHDDQVDSTTQMLAWARLRPPGYGMLEYYRQQSIAAQPGSAVKLMRFQAPAGTTHFYARSGRAYQVFDSAVEIDSRDEADMDALGLKRLI